MAFLKYSCPLTDSINKIVTIRRPAFSSPVTLLILENPKGKLMKENYNRFDVCNALTFLGKVSQALLGTSIHQYTYPFII